MVTRWSVVLVLLFILFHAPGTAFAEGFTAQCGSTSCAVFHVDLKKDVLRLMAKYQNGARVRNAASLKAWAERQGKSLIFATNSGIFDTAILPLGLHIEEGHEIVPINLNSGSGNFYLKPNGVFLIEHGEAQIIDSSKYHAAADITVAAQSGPLLLENGSIHPAFQEISSNRFIRSGVGVRGSTDVYFAISNKPINFFEFAAFFKETLHCESALYLDGFISQMYIADPLREQNKGEFAALFFVLADQAEASVPPAQEPAPQQ